MESRIVIIVRGLYFLAVVFVTIIVLLQVPSIYYIYNTKHTAYLYIVLRIKVMSQRHCIHYTVRRATTASKRSLDYIILPSTLFYLLHYSTITSTLSRLVMLSSS